MPKELMKLKTNDYVTQRQQKKCKHKLQKAKVNVMTN